MLTALADEAVNTAQTMQSNATGLNETMDKLMMIMFIGFGIYCIYTYFAFRGKEKLPEKNFVLLPGDKSRHCTDAAAYMAELLPKVLIFGICLLILGALQFLEQGLLDQYGRIMLIPYIGLPLILLVWYMIVYRRIMEKYWK